MMRLAQVRFGGVSAGIQAAIADAELEQFEHWLERLVTAPSLAAIFNDSAHQVSTRKSQAMLGITDIDPKETRFYGSIKTFSPKAGST